MADLICLCLAAAPGSISLAVSAPSTPATISSAKHPRSLFSPRRYPHLHHPSATRRSSYDLRLTNSIDHYIVRLRRRRSIVLDRPRILFETSSPFLLFLSLLARSLSPLRPRLLLLYNPLSPLVTLFLLGLARIPTAPPYCLVH